VRALRLTPGPDARAIADRYADDNYVGFHSERYAFALTVVARHCPHPSRSLDVGPAQFTELLAEQTGTPVDTLGFAPDGPSTGGGRHICYDLNELDDADASATRPAIGPYDLIVFNEVLEHLHTSPTKVLPWLRELLTPQGVLMIQTPNAAALGRRVRLLFGRNPYDLINTDTLHPRHFREYTRGELEGLVADAKLEMIELVMGSYFDHTYESNLRTRDRARPAGLAQNAVYRALPGSLRTGMTAVMRRASGG
jgi:SAM-dependent methyltransferase